MSDQPRETTGHTLVDVETAARTLIERIGPVPDVGLVLGSGLGGFSDRLVDPVVIPYTELPSWPGTNVIGHAGRLVVGSLAGRRVVVLSGRVHLYEGHTPAAVVFATRVLARAGVRVLILTNAAGGISPRLGAGSLMVLDDHVNFTGRNPLVGPNDATFGARFPDMSEVYSRRLRAIADKAAAATGVPLEHGIYIGVLGPSYETPAEIRAFRAVGVDAVGMSTVHEAIAARHMGLEVLGISCIANAAAGLGAERLDENDVIDTAGRSAEAFGRLLEGIIGRL